MGQVPANADPAGVKPFSPAADPPAQGRGVMRTFASFRHRNYQLWFSGQLISVIGTWMQGIAQGWLVYQISHSEFALGMVSFAAAIPVLLISPWSGVVVDAAPRRTLLVVTQTVAMVLALILAVLTFTNTVQVWHIMVLAMLLGANNAFDAPARQAIVVDLVQREDMTNAIALNSMLINGARVIGPALGGFLIAGLGTAWCFLINGLTFLAVIAALLAMVIPQREMQRKFEHPLRQFQEGLRYAGTHREILGMLILSTVMTIFGMAYSAQLPAFADKMLHVDASGYGALNALIGLGAVSGGFMLAAWNFTGKRGLVLIIANLVYPLVLAAFAFNSSFILALPLAYGLGLGFMLQANNMNSLIQMRVDDAMRGRVMSLYTITFFGLSPLGSLFAGALGERMPLSIAIAICAAIMLVGSLLVHWRIPEVRKMK